MNKLLNSRNGYLFLLLVAIIFPLAVGNNYTKQVLILAFIWAIAVYGLNIVGGFTGQLSLAHAGFFAVGAYGLGLLTTKGGLSFWLAFVLAILITCIIGFLIGLVALRTKEHFFAIYTLIVGYIIYLVIYKWEELTNGVRGLIGIPEPAPIGPITFNSMISKYYLVLFFLVLTVFLVHRIVNSLTGRTFIAIRNSEDLALTIGISTMKVKLLSFVISTFFAGLAGALYASFIRFIGPEVAYTNVVFDMLIYLLVGGIGTIAGPLLGTLLVVWLTQTLQFLQEYRMIIFGPILVLLIIYYPRGIAGAYLQWKMTRQLKKAQQAAVLQKQSANKTEGV